jgi:predicted membrane-bound mannosyltransferase
VSAPWTLVHVVVPLSLPAAVGLAAILRRGVAAASRPDADAGTVLAVVLVLVAVGGQIGAVAAADVYGPSDRRNDLAQFAQPSDDLEGLESAARDVADGDPSTVEVLYVGESFHLPADRTARYPPVGDAWGNRLPLPWYFESAGADAGSAANVSTFGSEYASGAVPPVVVAEPADRDALADRLGSAYESRTYRLGLWNREVVVFVRESDAATASSDAP